VTDSAALLALVGDIAGLLEKGAPESDSGWYVTHYLANGLSVVGDGLSSGIFPIKCEGPQADLIVAAFNALPILLPAIKALIEERDGMPTIWEDPAGKGYPCFERRMTAAECKETIERFADRLAASEAECARLREALELARDVLGDMRRSGVIHSDGEAEAFCRSFYVGPGVAPKIRLALESPGRGLEGGGV
jgi:hypothetical protein